MRCLNTVFLAALAAGMVAADVLPEGAVLSVRLDHWVSTHSVEPGDPVRATIVAPVWHQNRIVLSAGNEIHGRVVWRKKVGWGWRRERASIKTTFDELVLPGAGRVPVSARLLEVENARETVGGDGAVRGLRATTSPSARITSQLIHMPSLNLYPDPALLVYKLVMPFFPEPEIVFPPGTEFRVSIEEPVDLPDVAVRFNEIPEFSPEAECELGSLAQALPSRTLYKEQENGIINMMLIGDRRDIELAFEAAGWTGTDRMSAKAFLKQTRATLEARSYKRQPMWKIIWDGQEPDLMLQKSLNDFKQRHHVRFWKMDRKWNGQDMWAGAATRDSDVDMSFKKMKLVHRIESDIDLEREKIIYDLAFTGCGRAFYWAPRPEMSGTTINVNKDEMRTDGALAVAQIGSCQLSMPEILAAAPRPKRPNPVKRHLRKQLLVVRHDLIRSNLIYAGFDGSRMLWKAFRKGGTNLEIAGAFETAGAWSKPTPQRRLSPLACPSRPRRPVLAACRLPKSPEFLTPAGDASCRAPLVSGLSD